MTALDTGEPIVVRHAATSVDIAERPGQPDRPILHGRKWAGFQGTAELGDEDLFRVTGDPRVKDLDARRRRGAVLNPFALAASFIGLASLVVVTPLIDDGSRTVPLVLGISLSAIGIVGAFWTAEESRAKLPQTDDDERRARAYAERYNQKLAPAAPPAPSATAPAPASTAPAPASTAPAPASTH